MFDEQMLTFKTNSKKFRIIAQFQIMILVNLYYVIFQSKIRELINVYFSQMNFSILLSNDRFNSRGQKSAWATPSDRKNTMNSLFDNFKIDKLRSKKVDDDRDFAVEDFVLKVIHVLDFEGVPEDMSGSDAPLCKRAVHP